jgi:MraZ protein
MTLFLGEYAHSLDDRGRVTLPRKIRQELTGEVVVLSRGFDECIFGYDVARWEAESAKQLTTSVTDKSARTLRRYMFSAAEKAEVDRLGRIVLPAHLKEYAGVTKEIIVIGAGDHFELWDKTRWEAAEAELTQSI